MLKDPDVFLEPAEAEMSPGGARGWQRLLARCLAFAPEDRFASVVELADAIDELCEGSAPGGGRSLPLQFGALVRAEGVESPGGLAWLERELVQGRR